MRRIALALLLVGAGLAGEEGPAPLFDGATLDAFEVVGAAGAFTVRDGTIHCSGTPAGYLRTKRSFREFVLTFEWRYERPEGLDDEMKFLGNSGYLLFIEKDEIWPRSIEIQGMNRDVARIIPIKTKAKFHTYPEAREKARRPVGEWNTMEIRCEGGVIIAAVNGVPVSIVTGYEPREGPIGFQSEGAPLAWRNLVVHDLSGRDE